MSADGVQAGESRATTLEMLFEALERALDSERDALLRADASAIATLADDKLRTLAALRDRVPDQEISEATRLRLRAMAVANARNQVLLAVSQARVEARMEALGLLSPTYGPTGRAPARTNQRSTSC